MIGTDIPGLDSVREFATGVLIPEFTPEAIYAAIEKIGPERERLRANCLRAAAHFSFDNAVAPFVDFLAARRRPSEPT